MARSRKTTQSGVDGSGWQQQQRQQRPESQQQFRYGSHGRPVVSELGMVATGGRVRQGEGAERGIAVYDGESDDGEELEVRAGTSAVLCFTPCACSPRRLLVTVVFTNRAPIPR